jgi:hypothetical protein
VLHDCRDVFETVGDITSLAKAYGAYADLEHQRGHLQDALTLHRTALRLAYVNPEPRTIAISHNNLALYLVGATEQSTEQRAHRLASALLHHLIGDTHELTNTLQVLADELCADTGSPDAPAVPSVLSAVIRLVDAGDGVHFSDLVTALCPDPNTANQALADLIAAARRLPDQPPENIVERLLTAWDPLITAVGTAAGTGDIPTELAEALTRLGDTTDWAALATALCRVLAGDRDRKYLLASLDSIDAAILTAVLDRLPNHFRQYP